mmetsp:Transcript_170935/g.547817  ORF Transcript_170935/g.547817 Transcript_170935/m.547817 type:complete len:95 (-) Transcript_170935:293-577(-)
MPDPFPSDLIKLCDFGEAKKPYFKKFMNTQCDRDALQFRVYEALLRSILGPNGQGVFPLDLLESRSVRQALKHPCMQVEFLDAGAAFAAPHAGV